MVTPQYLHLMPGDALPSLSGVEPFKAVVVIEADVTPEWREQVSDWLVRGGCRYMMAWGRNCHEWDTSVDEANLAAFDFGEIPEDAFVMTTWHEDEPIEDVFWFSIMCAWDPSLELKQTYILHISPECGATALLGVFQDVKEKTA